LILTLHKIKKTQNSGSTTEKRPARGAQLRRLLNKTKVQRGKQRVADRRRKRRGGGPTKDLTEKLDPGLTPAPTGKKEQGAPGNWKKKTKK